MDGMVAGEQDPVRKALSDEVRRRAEVLAAAVASMTPVIGLLRHRQRSGADVGLRLPQPGLGQDRIDGWLRCAALHGCEPSGVHEYGVSVLADGSVQVCYPHPSVPPPEGGGWLAYHTPDKLADAVEAAETREEMNRLEAGAAFGL